MATAALLVAASHILVVAQRMVKADDQGGEEQAPRGWELEAHRRWAQLPADTQHLVLTHVEKIRFAFEDLQLRRLENGFFPGNAASFALQQHFGYQLEGTRRHAYRCLADGTLKDECITGLPKAEWKRG